MQPTEKQVSALSISPKKYCVFEYIYRDASNYKAWGEILLLGIPSKNDIEILRTSLELGEYFVAEQIGIPTLYQELWEFGGPNQDDHALHEFVALRTASVDKINSLQLFGKLSNFLKKFQAVTTWDYSLSPNFDLD